MSVFERACDAGYCACEVMVPGVCNGRGEHWHHRKLRSQGGRHEPVNGLMVCHLCHEWIHRHPALSYEAGWLVRSLDEPKLVPVVRRGRRVYFVGDSFKFSEVSDAES